MDATIIITRGPTSKRQPEGFIHPTLFNGAAGHTDKRKMKSEASRGGAIILSGNEPA
jgi:hypothetical protein